MTIREGSLEDLETILAIEAECFPDPWGEALIAPGLRGELPTVRYLIADGGYAVLSLVADIADLQRIAVREESRRHGVATALVTAAIRCAAQSAADRMLVEVRADNVAALRFYAHHDFVEIDRRPRYYVDGTEAVIMRRALGRGCGGRG